MDRDEAVELLRSQHAFPGPYQFRVVVRPVDEAPVLTAMAAATSATVSAVDRRPSSKGTYVALHVQMAVDTPESVLDIYAVLQSLDSVLTAM